MTVDTLIIYMRLVMLGIGGLMGCFSFVIFELSRLTLVKRSWRRWWICRAIDIVAVLFVILAFVGPWQ